MRLPSLPFSLPFSPMVKHHRGSFSVYPTCTTHSPVSRHKNFDVSDKTPSLPPPHPYPPPPGSPSINPWTSRKEKEDKKLQYSSHKIGNPHHSSIHPSIHRVISYHIISQDYSPPPPPPLITVVHLSRLHLVLNLELFILFPIP